MTSEIVGHPATSKKEIPLGLLRAGMKLTSLVPDKAKGSIKTSLSEKGIDLDLEKLDSKQLEGLLESLTEMSIDVDSDDGEQVKIYCA